MEIPAYFQKRLKDDEEVVYFIRPFGLVYFWWFWLSFILVFGDLFYMFYLLELGILGKVIFVFIILLGLMVFFKTMIIWRLTGFLVTNQRIVDFDQQGLFTREIAEAPFNNIQDITMEQKGFWATVLNFGTIKIQTASSRNKIEFQYIRNPRQIHENIMDLYSKFNVFSVREDENSWAKNPKLRSFFEAIESTKKEVGEEKFKQALEDWLHKE